MRSITRLFAAFGTLATALEGLALLIDTTSGKLRQSLALDAPEPAKLALSGPVVENAAPEATEEGPLPEASAEASPGASPATTRRRSKAG